MNKQKRGILSGKIVRVTILAVMVALLGVFLAELKSPDDDGSGKIRIVATNFPGYDFARAITRGVSEAKVKMLLKPGAESHDYEPTPQDIVRIKDSDVFIYTGGESDEWVRKILKEIDSSKTKVVKMMDLVELKEEELKEGMQEEAGEHGGEHEGHGKHEEHEGHEKHEEHEGHGKHEEHEGGHEEPEYDEHVWTSPKNAIKIVRELGRVIEEKNEGNRGKYKRNAEDYIEELEKIDKEISTLVQKAKRKELIFGDRFPLRYFVDDYGLDYYAGFKGCSEQTEASAGTIAFLIEKVRADNIPVVLKLEMNDGKIAKAIARETGAKVLEFHAIHNVSQKDFEGGASYVDLMERNIKVLEEALN